jgi:3-deoxy-D-manno-octulosonic-acid transferase
LVAAATRYGAPVVLVAGTVRAGSSRLSAPARLALRRAYEAIRWAGAVAPADADRLCRLGVSRSAVHVTGDPRHDQVIERRVSLGPGRTILQWSGGDPVMVAGSTDARDEAILLEAFRHVANHAPNARLVMVPHVVDRDAIRRRRDTASALGIPSAFLEPGAPGQARLLWGMTTGTLPDLYLAADFAYVGGGMTPGRLHAVAEPAGLGIPVLFGSGGAADLTADAAALLTAGGGIAVPPHAAPVAIARHWLQWLQDRDGARRAGLAARATLRSGAADRCASVILGWCG